MSYVVRCPQTGFCDWVNGPGRHRCSSCGKTHLAYEAGAPPKEQGCPNVVPDTLTPYLDYGSGVQITSRSQRNRVYREKGLNLNSTAEHKRKHGDGCWAPGRAMSYAGQKSHTSSAERAGVRTKDGRRVV